MQAVARTNSTSENLQPLNTRLFFIFATSVPCCLFFVINGTILFVLRSKPSFYQCPRYVLLFDLVLADTLLMAQAQVLYFLASFRVRVSFPLCVSLAMMSYLTGQISPYTLIFMSLERCVAVCFPFRHSVVVTLRNTFICVLLIWTVSSVDVLARTLIFLNSALDELPFLQMPKLCIQDGAQYKPRSKVYEIVFTYALFVFASLVICGSFVAVMVVARSASSDKSSADKAKKTMLLHMFQLVLNLITMLHDPLFAAVQGALQGAGQGDPYLLGRLYVVIYILVVLSPRCVSALTFGLRDSKLRPLLLSYLCCCACVRLGPVKLHLMLQRTARY